MYVSVSMSLFVSLSVFVCLCVSLCPCLGCLSLSVSFCISAFVPLSVPLCLPVQLFVQIEYLKRSTFSVAHTLLIQFNQQTDIDECKENTDNCSTNATCHNTPGSFNCTCNSGFKEDGVNCTGKERPDNAHFYICFCANADDLLGFVSVFLSFFVSLCLCLHLFGPAFPAYVPVSVLFNFLILILCPCLYFCLSVLMYLFMSLSLFV